MLSRSAKRVKNEMNVIRLIKLVRLTYNMVKLKWTKAEINMARKMKSTVIDLSSDDDPSTEEDLNDQL